MFFFLLFFSILFIKENPYFFEILLDISGFIGGTAFPFSFLLHYFLGSPYLTLFIRSHFNSDAVLGILNYRRSEKSNNSIYKMTRNHISFIKSLSFCYHCFEKVYSLLLTLQYKFVLLKCHGDIELNPDPEKLKAKRKMFPLSPIGVLIP